MTYFFQRALATIVSFQL